MNEHVSRLGLLASAIAHRPLRVAPGVPGELAWTDGKVVFVDANADAHEQLASLAVQAALVSAGSLNGEIARALVRRPTLATRYLGVEARRALATVAPLLPPSLHALVPSHAVSESPAASLQAARTRGALPPSPTSFGTIRARALVDEAARATATPMELDESEDAPAQDSFVGELGGGGAIGKWLAKMLTAARQLGGGGSPGADAPTHWTRTPRRGTRVATSHAAKDEGTLAPQGTLYPEWDREAQRYRLDWCAVSEVEPKLGSERFPIADRAGLRRALARLGLGIARLHRQPQGDDLDLDAMIEARIALLAGSAPDEDVFLASVRRRRDLSVLILLDVSGSAGEPGEGGKTVHELQRASAAGLALALHELGDRVALYSYNSQGRTAVRVTPILRFGEPAGASMLRKLGGLEPGGYSRLGAAIRHGTALLQDHAGTPRRLLLVLSDGLAYDHGYELGYGAADARRALHEARAEGVACLCLSLGAEPESLARVFGKAAHAALSRPEQLPAVIGPLFRSALRAADVRRRIA